MKKNYITFRNYNLFTPFARAFAAVTGFNFARET